MGLSHLIGSEAVSFFAGGECSALWGLCGVPLYTVIVTEDGYVDRPHQGVQKRDRLGH